MSWSPVADKQLSGQPKQKEGLPGEDSSWGPLCPLLPESPAHPGFYYRDPVGMWGMWGRDLALSHPV